ncbi:MAG: hypothetical protein A3F99_01300 [Candidatus Colwellbacteria bacterium RIFCSPLOWO2_12_FULL_43_11]|uniref:histidine kinase n=1 Tax=Candidatus Colwellbacteria bacterium RIFCSPLOWO2_12_FULL_43_11 TaxID=1797693 RepID=A0A1G1Z9A4_9BACT|nr:MAG: hypothetical protein A3F99_01300 [Candidatus Colwellbacteria bacterium RIFCSPLOWO2_12_FULL_43_11]
MIPAAFLWMFPLLEKRLTSVKVLILWVIGTVVVLLPYIDGLVIKGLRVGSEVVPTSTIQGLHINSQVTPILTTGYLFDYYSIFIMVFYAVLIYEIVGGLRKYNDVRKTQLKYILIGSLLFGCTSILVNFILPFFNIVPVAPYDAQSSIFFVAFSAYAILKHKLFDAKIIAAEVLTFVTWIFLLIQLLLAESLREVLLNVVLLVLIIFFGTLLIRSVFVEVEQRKKLEKLTGDLKAANDRLVKLDALKSQFLSFASHQVKTPITIVKGYASLIADGTYGAVSDKIKDVSKRIVETSDRMVSLVNNILDLRKLEDGRMDYKFADLDVVTLVKSVSTELKSIADRRGLELRTSLPDEKWLVKADEEKLRQVIQNLIDNALKYTEKGWIRVSMEKAADQVLVAVSDSGRGISKELLPRLFEQWTRDSKAAKEIQGTGLGLYIAKEIMKAHSGEIWAESPGEGKGSTFNIRLKLS